MGRTIRNVEARTEVQPPGPSHHQVMSGDLGRCFAVRVGPQSLGNLRETSGPLRPEPRTAEDYQQATRAQMNHMERQRRKEEEARKREEEQQQALRAQQRAAATARAQVAREIGSGATAPQVHGGPYDGTRKRSRSEMSAALDYLGGVTSRPPPPQPQPQPPARSRRR